MVISERRKVQEQTLQPAHVLRFVDVAVADIFDPRVCDPGRGHAAVRIEVGQAHDPGQLQAVWDSLDPVERAMPELALRAADQKTSNINMPIAALTKIESMLMTLQSMMFSCACPVLLRCVRW